MEPGCDQCPSSGLWEPLEQQRCFAELKSLWTHLRQAEIHQFGILSHFASTAHCSIIDIPSADPAHSSLSEQGEIGAAPALSLSPLAEGSVLQQDVYEIRKQTVVLALLDS